MKFAADSMFNVSPPPAEITSSSSSHPSGPAQSDESPRAQHISHNLLDLLLSLFNFCPTSLCAEQVDRKIIQIESPSAGRRLGGRRKRGGEEERGGAGRMGI